MSRRSLIVIIALVGIGAVALIVGLRGVSDATKAETGPTESSLIPAFTPTKAPPITGKTITGQPFDLADYAGKPIILNFWASWCGPCRREIPAIAVFAKSHPEIQILGVDYLDEVPNAAAFAKANGATWPSVVDDGPIGSRYKVPGLPTTFLINSQGQIVERILGEVTEPLLAAHVKAMTAQ